MEEKNRNMPLVSIIIPTYNSEKTVSQCLKSIKNQTYPNIEIIVVDGGSKDKTIESAKKYSAQVYVLEGSGMADATNFGVKQSKGRYIYRVDSDVVLDSTIVEEAAYKCEVEGYDGVCVFWIPDEHISFWAEIRKIEKESYIKNPNYVGAVRYNKPVLGARFLRKDIVFAIGGMDGSVPIAGEDYIFYNKLAMSNYKFALIDARERHIGEPRSLKEIFRKYFRYGCTFRAFLNANSQGAKQVSIFGRKYYIDAFEAALKRGLKFFIGLIIYEVVVYLSAFIGLLYSVITNKRDIK